MSARRHIGDPEILKKRIPQNPKYQHVRTRLNTGSSMTKYLERIEEIKRSRGIMSECGTRIRPFAPLSQSCRVGSVCRPDSAFAGVYVPNSSIMSQSSDEALCQTEPDYRYKKDELFKRIKVTTFAQLVVQVASVSEESDAEITSEELRRLEDNSSVLSETDVELATDRTNGKHSPGSVPLSPVELIDHVGGEESLSSARSTLQSVISGVGEMDLDNDPKKKSKPAPSPSSGPLDKPYPDCPFLLLDVRDRDCYDQCHVIGAYHYPIAMLSRTMNPFTQEILAYKNAQGKIIIIYDEDERIASQAATTMCERGFENLFMLSGGLKVVAHKFPGGLTTGTFPVTCLTQPVQPKSARKHTTPREPVLPAENKWRFSSQDLEKIEQHLEKMLMPTDTASRFSRLSTGRSESKSSYSRNSHVPSSASSVSSRSIRSISPQGKPWK